jgi:hypothetical protein
LLALDKTEFWFKLARLNAPWPAPANSTVLGEQVQAKVFSLLAVKGE